MELRVNYVDGVKFEALARGHRILSDQPREAGGGNAGMTPPELLLASLGTCAAYYAVEYLKMRSLPTQGLQVRVKAEKLTQPARLDRFAIEIEAPSVTETRHREGIVRAAQRCLIHNTLHSNPAVEIGVGPGVTMV